MTPFTHETLAKVAELLANAGELDENRALEIIRLSQQMEEGDPLLFWTRRQLEGDLGEWIVRTAKLNASARSAEREPERKKWKYEESFPSDDIPYLGPKVSDTLHERDSDVELVKTQCLPMLATPMDIAVALEIDIKRLRWLAFHNRRATSVHYITYEIPKGNGGLRLLQAPLYLMGRVQRWILDNILASLPVEESCHGFHPGRSVVTNARSHAGQAFVASLDLESFFPSIGWRRVRRVFHRLGYSPCAATILALLCTEFPRREESSSRGETHFVATGPRALPQGACTSPALSNQVARCLDRRLSALAHR
jgi:hypothetical protein